MSSGTRRSSRAFVAVVATLFFLLRFVWVPVHVAFEPHTDFHGCVAFESAPSDVETMLGGHDEDHAPHPAADHEIDVASRPLDLDEGALLVALAANVVRGVDAIELESDAAPARESSREPPRRPRRARAPPAA